MWHKDQERERKLPKKQWKYLHYFCHGLVDQPKLNKHTEQYLKINQLILESLIHMLSTFVNKKSTKIQIWQNKVNFIQCLQIDVYKINHIKDKKKANFFKDHPGPIHPEQLLITTAKPHPKTLQETPLSSGDLEWTSPVLPFLCTKKKSSPL